jgi:predicted N-acyltransferase
LVAPDAPADAVVEALAKGAQALATEADAWSVHWLFTRPGTPSALEPHGYMPRASFQYHWENKGFESFCDYLSSLKSKRRKEVRRERRAAQALGLEIQVEPGHTLSEDDISSFYACYRSTIDQRGAIPYLTPAWFQQLRTTLGHRALLVTARRDGQLIAGSLAFRRGTHLYGRYWGALEEVRALHFELCYYRLIEYAISEGITLFEAGAQGQHKISRGFLPRRTHSSHWIRHPGLANAVKDFLRREARHVVHDMDHLDERSPYRRAEACDEELSFSLPVPEEVSQ